MSVGVHSHEIPHEFVTPTRDMVIIRVPSPPKMIGSFHIPDMSREMAQHNVIYGLIVKCGPIAFQYKDATAAGEPVMHRQDAKIGDWVLIRPFAGTLVAGGKLVSTFGWRYVSSFQDIIGIIPADKMPAVDQFEWDSGSPANATPTAVAQLAATKLDENVGVRERTRYAKNK